MHVFGNILVYFKKQIGLIDDQKLRIDKIAFVMDHLSHDIVKHLRGSNENIGFSPIDTLNNVSFDALGNLILFIRGFLFFVLSKNIKKMYQELNDWSEMADWTDSEHIEFIFRIKKSDLSVGL